MPEIAGFQATGRRTLGPGADLVELDDTRGYRHTAVVFHPEHKAHPAIGPALDVIQGFLEAPYVTGLLEMLKIDREHGAFVYQTGQAWSLSEVVRALADTGEQGGVRAGLELMYAAGQILVEAADAGAQHGVYAHGGLNPWRVMLKADGQIDILGYALPQVEVMQFLLNSADVPMEDSFRYCPPERLEGREEGLQTDFFSLALVAFELMTGKPLYDGLVNEIRRQASRAEGTRRLYGYKELLPDRVRELLGRCLKGRMEDRFQDGEEFLRAVRTTLSSAQGPSLMELMEGISKRGQRRTSSLNAGKTQQISKQDMVRIREEAGGSSSSRGERKTWSPAEGGRSSAGRSPAGRSPAGRSPAGRSPAGRSPAGRSPAGRSPAGRSSGDQASEGRSSGGRSPRRSSAGRSVSRAAPGAGPPAAAPSRPPQPQEAPMSVEPAPAEARSSSARRPRRARTTPARSGAAAAGARWSKPDSARRGRRARTSSEDLPSPTQTGSFTNEMLNSPPAPAERRPRQRPSSELAAPSSATRSASDVIEAILSSTSGDRPVAAPPTAPRPAPDSAPASLEEAFGVPRQGFGFGTGLEGPPTGPLASQASDADRTLDPVLARASGPEITAIKSAPLAAAVRREPASLSLGPASPTAQRTPDLIPPSQGGKGRSFLLKRGPGAKAIKTRIPSGFTLAEAVSFLVGNVVPVRLDLQGRLQFGYRLGPETAPAPGNTLVSDFEAGSVLVLHAVPAEEIWVHIEVRSSNSPASFRVPVNLAMTVASVTDALAGWLGLPAGRWGLRHGDRVLSPHLLLVELELRREPSLVLAR